MGEGGGMEGKRRMAHFLNGTFLREGFVIHGTKRISLPKTLFPSSSQVCGNHCPNDTRVCIRLSQFLQEEEPDANMSPSRPESCLWPSCPRRYGTEFKCSLEYPHMPHGAPFSHVGGSKRSEADWEKSGSRFSLHSPAVFVTMISFA